MSSTTSNKPVEAWNDAGRELQAADLALRQLIEDICCGQRDKERLYDAGNRLLQAGNNYATKTAAKIRAIYGPAPDMGIDRIRHDAGVRP